MNAKSYEELGVWREAMDLVVYCYEATQTFPRHEFFGIASQLQRAVVSVPANIAEGQGRRSPKEFVRFLSIARGSLAEVETHIRIAKRLGYISDERERCLLSHAARVGRMLSGLIRSLATIGSS